VILKKIDTDYPLHRIRTLPIRGFLRGALFISQINAPTRYDAIALSDYLQSKYLDEQLTTIWGFTAQARSRSRILPIFKQDKTYVDGTFTNEFTRYAKENNETCVICITNPIDRILLKCGHMCMCGECSKKWIDSCPICRAKIIQCLPEIQVDKSKIRIIPQAVKE